MKLIVFSDVDAFIKVHYVVFLTLHVSGAHEPHRRQGRSVQLLYKTKNMGVYKISGSPKRKSYRPKQRRIDFT